jgi:hypothetical protein
MQQSISVMFAGLVLAALAFIGSPKERSVSGVTSEPPLAVADLSQMGWTPPSFVSNRTFFREFRGANLESLDDSTKVVFLDNDLFVVYHTRIDGNDRLTSPRVLEAFFIRSNDGSLIQKKTWPSRLRRSLGDLRESEARLIPMADGRFLVFAADIMTLYTSNLDLVKQRKLEPSGPTDFWAAQSIAPGGDLFLRYESTVGPRVTYSWLDSTSLDLKYTAPGYRDTDFPVQGTVLAGADSLFTVLGTGIRMINRAQQVRTICNDQLCRETGYLHVLSSRYLAWSGRTGFGVIDPDRGLVWSKYPLPRLDPSVLQFGKIQSAMDGTRFALWVKAERKALLDGVDIKSEPIVLVYDVGRPEKCFAVQVKTVRAQLDFALSPNGKKLAVFDGAKVRVWSIDDEAKRASMQPKIRAVTIVAHESDGSSGRAANAK